MAGLRSYCEASLYRVHIGVMLSLYPHPQMTAKWNGNRGHKGFKALLFQEFGDPFFAALHNKGIVQCSMYRVLLFRKLPFQLLSRVYGCRAQGLGLCGSRIFVGSGTESCP